ncbi:type I-E CRISPR-associated protein Cse2/CasB [Microbispora bryophytorum]|uniref:type I-E CRISPR-associated protein Cse2/CasB n=1 Tax=Microbispora bryophytorum TaxID=1460882 RepID=UPI0033ECA65E
MNGIPSLQTADSYVKYLSKVTKDDPGRRAALRRSLGKPVHDIGVRRAHAVVAPWLPQNEELPGRNVRAAVESAYYTVAALVAARPADRDRQQDDEPPSAEAVPEEAQRKRNNLGRTLGAAVREGKVNPDSIEARLHLLCRQDLAGLHRQLPGLIRQLHAREVRLDLAKLLIDLSRWADRRDWIVKAWLQEFYRTMNQNTDDVTDEESEDK